MKLPRTSMIAALIAVAAVAAFVFGKPLGGSLYGDAATKAVTADLTPLSHDSLLPLGPIPCWDGSTVDVSGHVIPQV